MKFSVAYLVLVAFTFLSLTPAGVSLAELRADDGFELDELDLGLEEDESEDSEEEEEEEEEDEKPAKSAKKNKDADEEDSEEESEEDSEEEEAEKSESEPEDEEDDDKPAPAAKNKKSEPDEEETYAAKGKKIAAFYFFADSHTAKSVSHVTAETAVQLEKSTEYDYVGTEAAVFASTSSAKSLLKGINKKIDEGKQLYADLNPEDAVEKFLAALKDFESNLDKLSDMKLLSDIIFYVAASYKLMDEDKKAASYFADYITLNPDAQPDASLFASEVISAFKDVKNNRRSKAKGSIKVNCKTEGALVFIDGRIAGMTPVTLRGIAEGKHYYRIHKNGYGDAGGVVSVRADKTASISGNIKKSEEIPSSFRDAEKTMISDFGGASMLTKAVDMARDFSLDNVLVVQAKIGSDERLIYKGYMIDRKLNKYKKSEAVFDAPEKGTAASSVSLQQFNRALIEDPYEFKPISDAMMEELDMIVSDKAPDAKDDDKASAEKKPVYKEWWLWTIVGVVVAGGLVGGHFLCKEYCGGNGKSDGATLDINFQ